METAGDFQTEEGYSWTPFRVNSHGAPEWQGTLVFWDYNEPADTVWFPKISETIGMIIWFFDIGTNGIWNVNYYLLIWMEP